MCIHTFTNFAVSMVTMFTLTSVRTSSVCTNGILITDVTLTALIYIYVKKDVALPIPKCVCVCVCVRVCMTCLQQLPFELLLKYKYLKLVNH